jgi:hypothetical protein
LVVLENSLLNLEQVYILVLVEMVIPVVDLKDKLNQATMVLEILVLVLEVRQVEELDTMVDLVG